MSESPLERTLAAWDGGQVAPQDLLGQVSMADAYTMQLQVLTRRLNAGHQQSGWKLGQTNTQLRAERGEHEPAPGFMLAENQRASGQVILTGTYAGLLPIRPGEHWSSRVGDMDAVELKIR